MLAVFAASVNFAQVAPIKHGSTKSRPTATPQPALQAKDSDDANDDDADLQKPPKVAQAPVRPNTAPPPAQGVRPAPAMPRVVTTPDANGNPTTAEIENAKKDRQLNWRMLQELAGIENKDLMAEEEAKKAANLKT